MNSAVAGAALAVSAEPKHLPRPGTPAASKQAEAPRKVPCRACIRAPRQAAREDLMRSKGRARARTRRMRANPS
jgi:hypothetical protein